jgi:GNAT superfamily N-acetyltransferase
VPIHVVVGGRDDIDAAVDVFVRGATARSGRSMDASHIEETRDRIARDDSWFFIARDESEPIGMAMAMSAGDEPVSRPSAPGLCYLDLIFVVPERWGEGVGSLLLDTVVSDARLRGFSHINLLTHDDNERAHTLYGSRGFERTGWSRMSSDPRNGMVSEWARDL